MNLKPAFAPSSTYRFQFNGDFRFEQARDLVSYLHDLGIGGCYASPIFKARQGSVHGYDVVDHGAINPELGTMGTFLEFSRELSKRNMGLTLDVVPNHMCIASPENRWWNDVLQSGPGSPFARCFDILWQPPKQDLANKVLLPFLGEQYGRMLENQEVKVAYQDGLFFVQFYSSRLPLRPQTWHRILDNALTRMKERVEDSRPEILELESIITALRNIPDFVETDPDRVRLRQRETESARLRIDRLRSTNARFRESLEQSIRVINGKKGNARSFDQLEMLLDDQAYRLCFWRVAADEINYRRFFDISDLAAIRVEEPDVFEAVHELVFKLIQEKAITGLRIDHVDGLFDPADYLEVLQKRVAEIQGKRNGEKSAKAEASTREAHPFHVVVEKVLVGDERLRGDWKTHGTTGYDFMDHLNRLFVDSSGKRHFDELYQRFTEKKLNFSDVLASCKKFIMLISLASEHRVLSILLDRISEQHRWSRDFTLESLRFTLREVIAYFPVYRSYIQSGTNNVTADDRKCITTSISEAKRHNRATDQSIFNFIQDVLLLQHPDGLTEEQIVERRNFVMRFQQLTSPVMAKGMEDTAFYRYLPLASLNEVGSVPGNFGIGLRDFHRKNIDRQRNWPYALLSTTTHDTKRSEDVRARMNVLSEMPGKWYRAIKRWQSLNQRKKTLVDGRPVPDANEEYLFYQTIFGSWPLEPMTEKAHRVYIERIQEYMIKAIKEAKVHTSWITPNETYETAVQSFVAAVLEPTAANHFLAEFVEFEKPLARTGMLNSLSQTLIKIASPGIPDFYQGTELWSLSLVDPDNRRPVDYPLRQKLLEANESDRQKDPEQFLNKLMDDMESGRIKLFLTSQMLKLRQAHSDLFVRGKYHPLRVVGRRRKNVVAFARVGGGRTVIAVAGRFFSTLDLGPGKLPIPKETWGNSTLMLRNEVTPGQYRDVFTGTKVQFRKRKGRWTAPIADILHPFSFALLEHES